ncbi:MAG: Hpt domain-containing protein [Planctomycetia bacterium]|nr:Hpt domain-containing protein [Planctomycetia bacterium]
MPHQVDREVLAFFVEEARGYLPPIREGLAAFGADPARGPEVLEQAFRHAHTIKGSASMLGLDSLSRLAWQLEEALDDLGAGKLPPEAEAISLLEQATDLIAVHLDGLLDSRLDETAVEAQATRIFRQLRGGPMDELPAVPELPDEVAEPCASEESSDGLSAPEASAEPSETDGVSPELLEVFALEAEDHLKNIGTQLAVLQQQPDNKECLQEVRRSAHTLKGSAGMVGFQTITELAHRMEDLLDRMYEGGEAASPEVVRLLFSSTDALEDMASGKIDRALLRGLYERYAQLLGGAAAVVSPQEAVAPVSERSPAEPALPGVEWLDAPTAAIPSPASTVKKPTVRPERTPAAAPARTSGQFLRIPLERLDELVKLVGELVINRTGFEQRIADFHRQLTELQPSTERLRRVSYKLESQYEASALAKSRLTYTPTGMAAENGRANGNGHTPAPVNRLAGLAHGHGFDDLEFDRYTEFHLISRELGETTSDIQTTAGELGHLTGDFESYLNRQARLSSEIEDKLMRLRMVPFAMLASRLHRTVRNVAHQRGKDVELVLEGESTELDKNVLEEMADPLLHLLRNAVDHGVEAPEARAARGKPARGVIRLSAYHEGSQVVVQIADDGGGLDAEAIRAAAIARGLTTASDAARLSDDELFQFVFLPGFSTARTVSEISGRGVGLDIVKAQVHKLKGQVGVESQAGQGTTFTIRLPMTLAIARALLVKSRQETFAVPLDAVRQILRIERGAPESIGREPVVRVGEQVYPLLDLGEVLNLKQPVDESVRRPPVLVLQAAGRLVALQVDHLLGGREIVIKNLGNHLRRVRAVSGATLMGDGSVVLILNPAELGRPVKSALGGRTTSLPAAPTLRSRAALSVMIVDDSPSVRRVMSHLIQRAGWQPIIAKDGLEALEQLQQSATPPDLVLLDIEMPRMDGYELLGTLRGQAAYRDLPVVMVTSRAGEKHRRKALQLGATDYVVKPYQDEALLDLIRRLAASRERQGVTA